MKKSLLAALIPLALMPLSSFAITLDDLKSNPERYVFVTAKKEAEGYVDVTTIKLSEYGTADTSSIDAVVYIVAGPPAFAIFEGNLRNYYNRDLARKYNAGQIDYHNGITIRFWNIRTYDYNGDFCGYQTNRLEDPIPTGSMFYHLSNFIYHKQFGEYLGSKVGVETY